MRQPQDYSSINPIFIDSSVKQSGIQNLAFIENNVHFILQLATVYLVKKETTLTTDKLTEILLENLIHDTLKANFVNDNHLETPTSKESLDHSTQLLRILSLEENFPIQELSSAIERIFNLDSTNAYRIIWPSWARSIYRDHLDRFVSFAEKIMNITPCVCKEETALKGIHAVEKFCESFRLPMTFEEFNLSENESAAICQILECSK